MKKLFLIIALMAIAGSGFAQQNHYSFSEIVESGQTLYFLKQSYNPQEAWVTYPCRSGEDFYYGYDKPTGDLVIPPTITHNDTVYTITRVDFSAFRDCEDITSVVFPNTLTCIDQASFMSCQNLTGEIVFPNSVTIIGDNAFSYCHYITSVVFGDSLREIRDLAFLSCYALEHISGLPESLTNLGDEAFSRCTQLCDPIVIPPHITTINKGVFSNCKIPSVVISEGVTTIKNQAFENCPITSIHIPSTVTSISPESYYGAFYKCTELQYITVAEANPVFDSRSNCNALIETATNTLLKGCKNSIIPDDVSIIATNAFSLINGLDSIAIPSSVERIQAGAFGGCNSLSTITLPSSVSYIGDKALNCCGLTSIISKSSNPPTAFNNLENSNYKCSFLGVNNEIPIYIPFGTTEAYRSAPGWDYFSNFIETEMNLEGEWYYEIINDNGNITYQHLEYASDTTINTERPKIIVRSNTHYDHKESTEVTHEYIYEENDIVYWWNKELQEFTTLYDLNAQAGDEWEIKVGAESIVMHVDTVGLYENEGNTYRMLRVSDENGIFSGDIVSGIGHLTSFFPERLMNRGKNYRVDGLRCYWVEDAMLYHSGDEDCDAILSELHGIDEPTVENGFAIYPNPANGVLFIETCPETCHGASLQDQTYRITNLMGQTLLQGSIESGNQQIDINALPAGMYFLTVDGETLKFVKQ